MDIVNRIILAMQDDLTTEQLQKLSMVIRIQLAKEEPETESLVPCQDGWASALKLFLATKKLSNCADSTIQQYERALRMMFVELNKPLQSITTNDLRYYMALYQERRKVSMGYMNTIRLYFSSFFGWCNAEGLIQTNPAARLDKIKTPQVIKHPFSSEELAKIRDACNTFRDRALVEVLYATGCRVGELCSINLNDVDFRSREIIVWGQKGKAERRVYLTDVAIYHLRKYILSRDDEEEPLFVSLRAPHRRMTKESVEAVLKKIGAATNIHCHPHKFRRTILTDAAKRGMPIQEIQRMAGHKKIDTTMMYVSVSDASVKSSYDRYIA